MAIITAGIDLAKNIFAVHGINAAGKPELVRPSVSRAKLLDLLASLPPCLIGMEACSGAHHWARQSQKLGHTVRIIAPKFVAPYRLSGKRGKSDAADAAPICEAFSRPHMHHTSTTRGKSRLGRITKTADRYLRSLLTLGASAVQAASMTVCSHAVHSPLPSIGGSEIRKERQT